MKYTNRVWLKFGIILIGLAVVCAADFIWSAWGIKNKPEYFQVLFVFAIFFTALGFFTYWLSEVIEKRWLNPVADKFIEKVRRAELGDEGEDGVCDELARILGSEYIIHRNFKISGRKFDIDAIVVGPKGVVVFEIKNYTNRIAFDRNDALVETKSGFKRIPTNDDPRNEVEYYCKELKKYFYAKGFGRLPLRKAVAFLKKDMAIILSDRIGVYVINGDERLGEYFASIPNDPSFTPELCAKINNMLDK